MTTRPWVKSIKIGKICDVISWTSSSKQSFNILFLGKYFFKSSETLVAEIPRHYAEDLKRNGCHFKCMIKIFMGGGQGWWMGRGVTVKDA